VNPNFASGLLLLDKPQYVSSRKGAAMLVRDLNIHPKEKWGFVGTLDPLATGLLPIAVGSGTKAISYLESILSIKSYLATFALGEIRRGDDATGEVISDSKTVSLSSHRIKSIQASLSFWKDAVLALQHQRPPDFSAKHIKGKRAYEWAREGRPERIPSSPVTVSEINVLENESSSIRWSIKISRGGYIRSLARDFGIDMGIGGYLKDIRRIQMGPLEASEQIWEKTDSGLSYAFVPFSKLFTEIPSEVITRFLPDVMTGQKDQVKASQVSESMREYAYSTVHWQGQSYGIYLRPLRHMPGHTYKVLKRTQLSCRIGTNSKKEYKMNRSGRLAP
jgi:tRNA pseudouridine55 synthase